MVPVFHKINHYFQKLKIVGLRRFVRAIWCRMRRRIYIAIIRVQIFFGIHETSNKLFQKKRLKLVPDFLQNIADTCDRKKIIAIADEYVAKRFDLLGSAKQSFSHMPWHEDFRLSAQDKNADYSFDAQAIYAGIQIQNGVTEKLSKDIKLPWELSRFQHLPVLAYAYHVTGNVRYAEAAKELVVDWIDHNQFLQGINWVCPMEVAIRATNWIVAWQWLQEPFCLDKKFFQRMIRSLYDHMLYLENNWEFYDGRTSNHYLSNLVGYLYLCYFFDDAQKFNWCYQELLCEFDWQIFNEGTSYEGSTRYHQLVTELFLHGFLLAQSKGKKIASSCLEKMNRMIEFLQWCHPSKAGEIVSIGDDDSGCLLHKDIFPISQLVSGFAEKQNNCFGIKQYKQFGLSIIRTNEWYVTLRHHAYTNRQPSGHFHNDVASITLAHKGIPILVDPGSYLYTASAYWRNKFRSVSMHNTMYVDDCEPVLLDNRLFALDIPQAIISDVGDLDNFPFSVNTGYALYSDIYFARSVTVDVNRCTILDRMLLPLKTNQKRIVSNFIFAADIVVQPLCDAVWLIMHNRKPLLKMVIAHAATSELYKTWVAPSYGKKILVSGIHVLWNLRKEPCAVVKFEALGGLQ